MKIDGDKWDQFIKSYFVAILGGIISGFMVLERDLPIYLWAIYIIVIAMFGGIFGYFIYLHIGKKQEHKNKDPTPPPPQSNSV